LWLDAVFNEATPDSWLVRMLSHIYLAEQVWFQRIYGQPTDSDVFATKSRADLSELAGRHEVRYAEVLVGDLDRAIAYKRFNGDAYETPLGDILLHLVTHGAHHRGQMASHASREKLPFPATDYINFSRIRETPTNPPV
jgi:uncharacterized damage-inducible protein DinB